MSLEITLEDPEQRQSMFRTVLNTIPIPVITGELHFQAKGIPYSIINKLRGEEKRRAYIAACKEVAVMPYTTLQLGFSYDEKGEISPHKKDHMFGFPEKCTSPERKEILELVLSGGRVEKIEIDSLPSLKPGKIGDSMLGLFLDAPHYDITRLDLWLATYSISEMNGGGEGKNSGISCYEWDKKLELQIGHELESQDAETVSAWFEKLQDSKQILLF